MGPFDEPVPRRTRARSTRSSCAAAADDRSKEQRGPMTRLAAQQRFQQAAAAAAAAAQLPSASGTRKRARASSAGGPGHHQHQQDEVGAAQAAAAENNPAAEQQQQQQQLREQLRQELRQLQQNPPEEQGPAARTRKHVRVASQLRAQRQHMLLQETQLLVDAVASQTNDGELPTQLPKLLSVLAVLPESQPMRVHVMGALFSVACRNAGVLLEAVLGHSAGFQHIMLAMQSPESLLATPAALMLAHMVKAVTDPFQPATAPRLLSALQPHLTQLLLYVHGNSPALSGLMTAVTSACLGLMMASIRIGPAAMATILEALLDRQGVGLKHLLQGLLPAGDANSSNCTCYSSESLSAIGMATISFLAGVVQGLAGLPAAAAAAEALVNSILGGEQKALTYITHVGLTNKMSRLALNVTFVLRMTAQSAPARLLDVLLRPKHRKSLQFLISMVCGIDDSIMGDALNAVTRIAQVATAKQLSILLRLLLPRMLQPHAGSTGAGHCVAFIAQMPAAVPELLCHVRELLSVMRTPAHNCKVVAASVLWHLAHHPAGLLALATQRPLDNLVSALASASHPDVAQAAASIIYLASQTPNGNAVLLQYVPALLQAALAPQGPIASNAMASVAMLASRSIVGARHVLLHAEAVLHVMLHPLAPEAAASPGNAAQQAGYTLFHIWQCPGGPHVLSTSHNLDLLLAVVAQKGPAMADAANALRQLLGMLPPALKPPITPGRRHLIESVVLLLQDIMQADSAKLAGDRGYLSLSPVYYMSMAAGAFGFCPAYLEQLVEVMQRPETTMPAFEILTHIVNSPAGLLALAPYTSRVLAAMTTGPLAEDSALQAYIATLMQRVQVELQLLRARQQHAQQVMHHAGILLAQESKRLRRRPRSRKQQVVVQLLLRRLMSAEGKHAELQLQLKAAETTAAR